MESCSYLQETPEQQRAPDGCADPSEQGGKGAVRENGSAGQYLCCGCRVYIAL